MPSAPCPSLRNDDAAARRLARGMAVVTAFCLTGDTMLYIALPLCWRECGLTALWQVGVLLAVNRLVRLPLNPLVRRIYTRVNRRTGMLLAVLLAASTTLLYGVAQSFALWLLLRCLWGLAWTLLRLGALFALAAASRKDNRGYLMGSYNGLVRLGSLAGMLGGGLLADMVGFSAVALLFGVLTLAAFPLALRLIPDGGRPDGAQGRDATTLLVRRHLRLPAMRRIFVTGFLVTLVFQGIYAASLSRMVVLHVGELALFGTLLVGCATLAGILQALRWFWEPWLAPWFGRLSDGPRGRAPVLCACLAGGACALALVALPLPVPLWLALLLFSQFCATGLSTLADAAASDTAEQHGHPTLTLASYTFIADCGSAVGPVLAYTLQERLGMDAAYVAAALCLLPPLVLWGVASRPREAERPRQQ